MWSKVDKIETRERDYQEARYFPTLKESDVGSITVTSKEPSFEYVLRRIEDRWYIDSRLLDIEQAYQLTFSILEMSKDKEIEAEPNEARLEEFKLHDPSYIFTVVGNNEDEIGTIELGSRTPDFNHFYARKSSGGPVSTVSSLTLGVLEEKPSDLWERSVFPVEIATVETFALEGKGQNALTLQRDQQNEELFQFTNPALGPVDETKVKSFLEKLKQVKIGRFLNPDEELSTENYELRYSAGLSYTQFEMTTELYQRVTANPKLLYGRRYLRKKGSEQALPGTSEKFVAEIPSDGELTAPSEALFQDRRLLQFEINEISKIEIQSPEQELRLKRNKQGKWVERETENVSIEGDTSTLLWALKDLRFERKVTSSEKNSEAEISIHLILKSGSSLDCQFFRTTKGEPVFFQNSKVYTLPERSWDSLSEVVVKLLKTNVPNTADNN